MLIVGLVPARSGSKSIQDKNILPLGGHPLVAYPIAAGALSSEISEVVVTTDSEEYAEICRSYGATVPFLRPNEISADDSLDIQFVEHYLDYLDANGMQQPDLLVHLRPTTPLRDIEEIDSAVRYMRENPQATSLRSAHKTTQTPFKMFVESGEFMEPCSQLDDCLESYNLPRQRFPQCYDPNGYVDVLRPHILRTTGMLHGNRIKLWQTDPVADIDELYDYEHAKRIFEEPRFSALHTYLKGIQV